MVDFILLDIALVIAFLDWIAVAKQWKAIEYIAKPGVMLLILFGLIQNDALESGLLWFTLGIGFSMAGDIFLMLPTEQFIAGLIAFLLAHVAYILGLNSSLPPFNLASFILAILVLVASRQIFLQLSTGIQQKCLQNLIIPVFIYSIIISVMLFSAFVTLIRYDWTELTSILVSMGALLFFISDTILAWNKFIKQIKYSKILVIIPYHIGQILLVLGGILHYQ